MTVATALLDDLTCELGEGPTWDADRGVAHIVDIDPGILWEISFDPAPTASVVHRCGTTLGAAVHALGGGFLLAAGGALRHIDEVGTTVREVPLIPASVRSRLNDGATDPAGRYLVGSLALDGRRGQERLWRLDVDGSVTVIDDDLHLSNGLGWSPDGGAFYSIDSAPGTVWARDYDVDSGRIGPRHRLLEITGGTPDGMAVDAEGNLWVAIWDGGVVRGFSSSGELLESIEVGPPHTTSCAFVGPELRTLLITTAGSLFRVDLPVGGRPTTAWCPLS